MISRPLRPTPTPPGLTSPSIMWLSGTPPPSGVKLSCIELTEPLDVPVVEAAQSAGGGRSEADLLALHVPAGLVGRDLLGGAEVVEPRVAVALEAHGARATCRPR